MVPPLVIDSIRGEEGDLMEAMVRKPLVIFLHGASLRGNNLSQVRRYGTLDALSKGLNLDAYVLAPQHPTGGWQPERIDRLVDWALERYAIDSTRIYVLGMSMGGFGTIDYAAASPHRVAAGLALAEDQPQEPAEGAPLHPARHGGPSGAVGVVAACGGQHACRG